MSGQFLKWGGAWMRKDDSGQLFAVDDPDTLKGLKMGQLPYSAIENTRGLTFGNQQSPAKTSVQTPEPPQAPQSGSTDISSLIKERLVSALTNYKGVTDTAGLETRRQELLRKQLLSAPYSTEGESTLTGAQKLSLLRSRGTEFDPEIKSLEEQLIKAKQGDSESLNNLSKLISIGKDIGVFGEDKHSPIYYEWQDAKASGYKGSFNEYSDMDANRKRAVTISSGMDQKQVTVFNGIVDKYNKSPLVAAKDRTLVVDTVAEELKKDPKNASLQLSFIYSFVQMLDTYQSAVREGEIGILQSTQGLSDKLSNLTDKISQGTILSTNVINSYIKTANTLSSSIKSAADLKKRQFGSQAKVAGVGDAWNEYLSGVEMPKDTKDSGSFNKNDAYLKGLGL